ncbi:hypothetical protein CC1G_04248 [Coprinopsis cinerea okayama7|uniref:Uncharacterized protein n=1 Tax=Coprinopsis cinerea (strain Okayama-7 / 130 / ATCC MYA-4618 / FGSC 9003) TaxID=240176 RepID=A8NFF4_COPC7|nr:hypothetical protein CC1G_04248 [Coprinopsis cinerea okayama7\|eukprot:XP_001833269.1 hypothetical protein CC1G_04248 [Coprinopsis cinerea okayama7\
MVSESPLTSPERSPSHSPGPSVGRRTAVSGRKRQFIASDDDEDDVEQAPVASSSKSNRRQLLHARALEEDEDEGYQHSRPNEEDVDVDIDGSSDAGYAHTDDPFYQSQEPVQAPVKEERTKKSKSSRKGSGKSGPPTKKVKRSSSRRERSVGDGSDMSDEEFEADFMEDEDDDMRPVSEEEYSDEEEYGRKKGKGKAVGKGGKAKGGKGTRRAASPEIKFRNEGKTAPPPPARTGKPDPLPLDDMDVDVTNSERSGRPLGTADSRPSGSSKSPASRHGSVPKDTGTGPPPQKKRKLPTIKKNKDGTAPTTPATAKSTVSSILSEVLPATPAPRLPAAQQGVADLDLTNKNIYDQLFKGGASALSSDRRAKEAERQKELMAMKEEWKAKRAVEQRETPPFDLQAQYEKISRFEERLRTYHSGALYPHYLAGKWREMWERSKAREREQRERESQESQPLANGTYGHDRR